MSMSFNYGMEKLNEDKLHERLMSECVTESAKKMERLRHNYKLMILDSRLENVQSKGLEI